MLPFILLVSVMVTLETNIELISIVWGGISSTVIHAREKYGQKQFLERILLFNLHRKVYHIKCEV